MFPSFHRILFVVVISLFVFVSAASAQNSNDRGTPADSKKGQATQSTYARDKIETVNLANGNFSLAIPLATIGGRGSASFSIVLSYNSKVWSTQSDNNGVSTAEGSYGSPRNIYSAMYDKTEPEDYEPYLRKLGGGWSILTAPGVKLRMFGIDPKTSGCNHTTNEQPDCGFKYALTKVWVTLPDGSQLELRDVATQGAPSLTTDHANGYYYLKDRDRGRIWRSVDGSNVIFVRDAGYPVGQIGGQNEFPSGWVFLPDGTRMRMDQGVCSKIVDRNGNFITIAGGTYTDQLGRQTMITGDPLTVTVLGHMGTPARSLTLDFGTIGDLANLRADFHSLSRPFTTGDAFRDAQDNFSDHTDPNSHTDLFIKSEVNPRYGGYGLDVGTKTALTQLNLPDNRSLRFRYNQYGEVAEVVYPGGGVSQIDYASGFSSSCEIPAPFNVNRGVIERRTRKDDGTVDATWLYSPGGEWIDGVFRPAVDVEARQGGASGTLLLRERHFFRMLNAEYRQCGGPYTGSGNEKWENAKEFRTETSTGNGTTVTVREWQQRAAVTWANDVGHGSNVYVNDQGHGQDQPPNDPRVAWEETTLEDGKVKRVEYGYDQFNNVTSVKEYDFGTAGSPGTLLRQTLRTYGTNIGGNYGISINGYCYSNLNPTDSSCGGGLAGDVTSIIYQPGLLISETVKDGNNNQKAHTSFEYDIYTTQPNHAALVINSGMLQYDGSRFGAFSSATQPRGNLTSVTLWLSGGADVVAYTQYDNAGNAVWSKDPNGNVSTVSYVDNFGSGDNPVSGVGGPNGATFALPSLVTNAVGHQVKIQSNYALGAVTGVKDANNVVTKTEYDALGRPVRVTNALGLGEQSISELSYQGPQDNSARVSKQLDATRWLVSKTDFDGFDRPKTSWQSEDGLALGLATFTIRANTIYDPLGRVKQASDPYRPATETPVYASSAYDLAGRVITVTAPDGGAVTTSYVGNTSTVTDQSGKTRRSVTDGLGRLTAVFENPGGLNYETDYAYDTLDNLTSVSQGSQTRTFVYDSLKRLRSATNPESGKICYGTVISDQCQANGYDANGNLIYKTDARGVLSTFAYDALNRNTSVAYSNDPAATPAVNRTYDGATNGKGRLWKSETAGATASRTTINDYDALGRVLSQSQQFYSGGVWSADFSVAATYDKAGHVLMQTYPSRHTVSYAYDNAGRTSSVSGNLGEGVPRTYANEFQYTALGAVQQEKFGTDTPLYHKQRYNQRGQLWDMRLSSVPFAADPANGDRGAIVNYYSNNSVQGGTGTDNNGNLLRQEIYIPGSGYFQQNFAYDSLSRLTSVAEKLNGAGSDTFKQAYTFDRWGNRTIDQANTTANVPHPEYTVDLNNKNRLVAPAGYTHEYDAAGNQTRDTYTTNSPTAGYRTYDAENRIVAAQKPVTGKVSWSYYTYDANGQRVRRKVATFEIWQVYGLSGELLAEYPQNGPSLAIAQPQKEYGYRNGQLLVTAEPFINAAWNKSATQTDNLNPTSTAAKAVDGDVDGELAEGHTAATNSHPNSWWQVDLGSVQTISSLTVWGRTDCCPEMTSDFHVFVSDSTFTSTDLNTTINQAGVSNYLHSGFAGPGTQSGPASITVNRTGRYVRVQLAGTGSLALGEVQVWSAAAKLEWLVTDHLGTPRMIVDKTGSLAGVSRHDYLPFGEDLSVSSSLRSTTPGYSLGDGARQKFSSKERDNETGLDYFGARYYASLQGRFLSGDPLLSTGEPEYPQTWNRYAYAFNSPLFYTDPTGLYVCQGNTAQCAQFATRLNEARENLTKIEATYGKDSEQYKKAAASVNSFGVDETGKKKNNGVYIKFDKKGGGFAAVTTARFENGKLAGPVTVHFTTTALDSENSPSLVAHEGSHIDDDKKIGPRDKYAAETDAHNVQSIFEEAQHPDRRSAFPTTGTPARQFDIWNPSWEGPDKATLRSNAIKDWLAVPKKEGGYGLTPPRVRSPQARRKAGDD